MMTESPSKVTGADAPISNHELLLRLDLAAEVLEGLDELGVDNRDQVEALVVRLERHLDNLS
ncbi:MAG: hypothetical protein H0T18_08595 [Chloroflexia bacterium]|nr:hypothetical protein [Chloroflexia bacterium]